MFSSRHTQYVSPIQPQPQPQTLAAPEAASASTLARHYQGLDVGVLVPLVQSFISGIMLGMVWLVVTWLKFDVPFVQALENGVIIWIVTQCAAWFGLLTLWTLRVGYLEKIFRRDLNQDGMIGEAPPPAQQHATLRLEVKENKPTGAQIKIMEANARKLVALCVGLSHGWPFTEKAWTGKGKPLSNKEFESLRDHFLRHGWAEWKNPEAHAQGVVLTEAGQQIVDQVNAQGRAALEG